MKNKFSKPILIILLVGLPVLLSLLILFAAITKQEYFLLLFCLMLWIIAGGILVIFKNLDKELDTAVIANESIKNYKEKIIIDTNEYYPAREFSMKNGQIVVPKRKFLEVNKSNELFKNGKSTNGNIIRIIDKRELDLTYRDWKGYVYLVVEFKNEAGITYKVKTPAVTPKVYSSINVGKTVKVYYSDTDKRPAIEEYEYEGKNRVKIYYDDIDFYVTGFKDN